MARLTDTTNAAIATAPIKTEVNAEANAKQCLVKPTDISSVMNGLAPTASSADPIQEERCKLLCNGALYLFSSDQRRAVHTDAAPPSLPQGWTRLALADAPPNKRAASGHKRPADDVFLRDYASPTRGRASSLTIGGRDLTLAVSPGRQEASGKSVFVRPS
jgi:hypothetical protein